MLTKVHKKLNRIFILFTSCLLLVLVTLVVLFNINQMDLKGRNNFYNLFYTVLSKLQSDTNISSTWLSTMQKENQMLIVIDDNGNLISMANKNTVSLFMDCIDSYANEEGITLTSPPIFSNKNSTQVYTLKSEQGTTYYGAASVLMYNNGYRALYLFQQKPELISSMDILFYLLICILGFGGVYLLSHFLIAKAMLPVQQSQEQQKQFIAAASHELRSPLTVIRTNNSICKNAEDTIRRKVIEKECVRMSRLISDLLALANMDAKNYTCLKEEVDCDTLLIEVYDAFLPAAEEKGLTIDMQLPEEELPKITGDYERIKQILSVLLDNAISYSPAATCIQIEGNVRKNVLELKVIDHGPGIPNEAKAKVFERFYRADAARKDKEHFGLGLSIAKQLAELLQSDLLLEDTPGGGTTFILRVALSSSVPSKAVVDSLRP